MIRLAPRSPLFPCAIVCRSHERHVAAVGADRGVGAVLVRRVSRARDADAFRLTRLAVVHIDLAGRLVLVVTELPRPRCEIAGAGLEGDVPPVGADRGVGAVLVRRLPRARHAGARRLTRLSVVDVDVSPFAWRPGDRYEIARVGLEGDVPPVGADRAGGAVAVGLP